MRTSDWYVNDLALGRAAPRNCVDGDVGPRGSSRGPNARFSVGTEWMALPWDPIPPLGGTYRRRHSGTGNGAHEPYAVGAAASRPRYVRRRRCNPRRHRPGGGRRPAEPVLLRYRRPRLFRPSCPVSDQASPCRGGAEYKRPARDRLIACVHVAAPCAPEDGTIHPYRARPPGLPCGGTSAVPTFDRASPGEARDQDLRTGFKNATPLHRPGARQ